MPSNNSNDDVKIYNNIEQYNVIADDLSNELNSTRDFSLEQKQKILYPIIDEIRDMAEEMIENYILYIKDKENTENLDKLRDRINEILEKIDYFKNKVYEIYKINNEKK